MQRFSQAVIQKVSGSDCHLCTHDKECLKFAPGIYSSHNGCRLAKETEEGPGDWCPFEKHQNVFRLLWNSSAQEGSTRLSNSLVCGVEFVESRFAYGHCVQACADVHQRGWHRPWLSIHGSGLRAHGSVRPGCMYSVFSLHLASYARHDSGLVRKCSSLIWIKQVCFWGKQRILSLVQLA